MSQVKLGNLVAKLSPEVKASLEEAAGAAMKQTVAAIEIEHWFVQLLAMKETHLMSCLKRQHIDADTLLGEFSARIERLTRGSQGQPTISQALSELMEEAWLQASVNFGQGQISSLHLLLVLVQADSFGLKKIALESLDELSQEALTAQITQLESVPLSAGGHATTGAAGGGGAPAAGGALDKYTINLTQQARDGNIDPISGRNSEVRMAIDILCRKRQNNPILVGEPGVGKTAVVEGLALRIVSGEVPPAIQGVEIHALDLGLLQAGASIKGEFEKSLERCHQ